MKFLLLTPFLLAPVFSQFGFVGDIANTIKNVAEDGAKTVQNIAVDGAHQVQNLGNTVINELEMAERTVERVATNIQHHIQTVANPPEPQPNPVPIVPEIIQVPQIMVDPVPQNSTPNLQKQQENHSQSNSESQEYHPQKQHTRHEGTSRNQERQPGNRGQKHRKHGKKQGGLTLEQLQEIKQYREQIQTIMTEFRQVKDEYQKQGKKLEEQIIQTHRQEMRKLHEQIKQIRMNNIERPNRSNQNEVVMDIEEERLILKEKIRVSKDMAPEERQKFREQMRKQFKQKQKNRRKQMHESDQKGQQEREFGQRGSNEQSARKEHRPMHEQQIASRQQVQGEVKVKDIGEENAQEQLIIFN